MAPVCQLCVCVFFSQLVGGRKFSPLCRSYRNSLFLLSLSFFFLYCVSKLTIKDLTHIPSRMCARRDGKKRKRNSINKMWSIRSMYVLVKIPKLWSHLFLDRRSCSDTLCDRTILSRFYIQNWQRSLTGSESSNLTVHSSEEIGGAGLHRDWL